MTALSPAELADVQANDFVTQQAPLVGGLFTALAVGLLSTLAAVYSPPSLGLDSQASLSPAAVELQAPEALPAN